MYVFRQNKALLKIPLYSEKELLTKLMKGKKLSVLGSLKLGGQPCVHMKASCAGI